MQLREQLEELIGSIELLTTVMVEVGKQINYEERYLRDIRSSLEKIETHVTKYL